jgi:hypothetical protein
VLEYRRQRKGRHRIHRRCHRCRLRHHWHYYR